MKRPFRNPQEESFTPENTPTLDLNFSQEFSWEGGGWAEIEAHLVREQVRKLILAQLEDAESRGGEKTLLTRVVGFPHSKRGEDSSRQKLLGRCVTQPWADKRSALLREYGVAVVEPEAVDAKGSVNLIRANGSIHSFHQQGIPIRNVITLSDIIAGFGPREPEPGFSITTYMNRLPLSPDESDRLNRTKKPHPIELLRRHAGEAAIRLIGFL